MSESTVIEIGGLEVRYGRARALDGVDLRVSAGEVVAVLGRNGAGKSSLVRCLLGQQKPDGGGVRLFAQDVWRHRARLMARVGVVPEDGDAPPTMTARQLARFCASLYPSWDPQGFDTRLRRFDVPADRPFGRLSKGQKAQVMLALALAPSPELLVLDDPTLGLDVVARQAVFEEVVTELADRGITVLITSHDLPGIEAIASRVALLRRGRLLLDEDLESLKGRFRRLLLPVADGVDPALDAMEPVCRQTRGRNVEALVGRFDSGAWKELEGRFGAARAAARAARLEDILVALDGAGEVGEETL